jgi:hypothetical protein
VVAPDQQEDEAAVLHHGDRLHGSRKRQAEQRGDFLAGLLPRSGDFLQRFFSFGSLFRGR